MVQIKEVTNVKELKKFVRFPHGLYRGNKYWVPPLFFDEMNTLRWDKNPAFEHCETKYLLAYKDGKIAGRVAAILNHLHYEKWGQRYIRFGWIDFIDDIDVSAALVKAVESWAREKDMVAIHGPLGFTDSDPEGMLIEGFDELSTMATIYNYPYYPEHLKILGFEKDTDWVEYEVKVDPEPHPKITKASAIVLRRYNLTLLEAKHKKDLLPYARELFQLVQDEYAHLYGTVPLTDKQVDNYVDQYFGFITPDYVPIVLDEEGKMVGFGVGVPSLSRALQKGDGKLFPFGFIHLLKALRKNTMADLLLIAVKSEYQGKGVNAVLMYTMHKNFNKLGITKVESNPELETNRDVQGQWRFYETRQHKRRRCFIKHLEEVG